MTVSLSFRSLPTTEWFISWAHATFVILLPLSILVSPLPFLSYYYFQYCPFFCPSGQSGLMLLWVHWSLVTKLLAKDPHCGWNWTVIPAPMPFTAGRLSRRPFWLWRGVEKFLWMQCFHVEEVCPAASGYATQLLEKQSSEGSPEFPKHTLDCLQRSSWFKTKQNDLCAFQF